MNLEKVTKGEVVILTDRDGKPISAHRVTQVSAKRVTVHCDCQYDISTAPIFRKDSGKEVGGDLIARLPTPDDDLLVLHLEMQEENWETVPLEKLRKIREILQSDP